MECLIENYIRLVLESHCEKEPQFFYVGFAMDDRSIRSLEAMRFIGMGGVTASRDVAKRFAVYEASEKGQECWAVLRMPKDEFLSMNSASCVDYDDIDAMLRDNGRVYQRVFDSQTPEDTKASLEGFFIWPWYQMVEPEFRKSGIPSRFLLQGGWPAKFIERGGGLGDFNSAMDIVKTLVPMVNQGLIDEGFENGLSEYWRDNKPDLDLKSLARKIEGAILREFDMMQVNQEQEWVLNDSIMSVPSNSTLILPADCPETWGYGFEVEIDG